MTSDPVNILNHQSKQSDRPRVNTPHTSLPPPAPHPRSPSTHSLGGHKLILSRCFALKTTHKKLRRKIDSHWMQPFRNARVQKYKETAGVFILALFSFLVQTEKKKNPEELVPIRNKTDSPTPTYFLCHGVCSDNFTRSIRRDDTCL